MIGRMKCSKLLPRTIFGAVYDNNDFKCFRRQSLTTERGQCALDRFAALIGGDNNADLRRLFHAGIASWRRVNVALFLRTQLRNVIPVRSLHANWNNESSPITCTRRNVSKSSED